MSTTVVCSCATRGVSIRLAALSTAPKLSRTFVVQTLRAWQVSEACCEIAELLASELVTNAVKQTGRVHGPAMPGLVAGIAVVSIRAQIVDSAVRLEAWDRDPQAPKPMEPDPETEGGRGLLLVEALSRAWGTYPAPGGGKVVWAEVGIA